MKFFLISIAFVFGLQFIIFHPASVWSQSNPNQDTSPTAFVLSSCYINGDVQPSHEVQMDTQRIDGIIRTLYTEMQTFVCKTQANQPVIADVSFYVRMIDGLNNQTSLERDIEVVTCIKGINLATILQCTSEQPPTSLPAAKMCSIQSSFMRPIVMNSEAAEDRSVKTTVADSKIYFCKDSNNKQMIKDVITFIESYENLDFPSTKRSAEAVTCIIEIVNLKTRACDIVSGLM